MSTAPPPSATKMHAVDGPLPRTRGSPLDSATLVLDSPPPSAHARITPSCGFRSRSPPSAHARITLPYARPARHRADSRTSRTPPASSRTTHPERLQQRRPARPPPRNQAPPERRPAARLNASNSTLLQHAVPHTEPLDLCVRTPFHRHPAEHANRGPNARARPTGRRQRHPADDCWTPVETRAEPAHPAKRPDHRNGTNPKHVEQSNTHARIRAGDKPPKEAYRHARGTSASSGPPTRSTHSRITGREHRAVRHANRHRATPRPRKRRRSETLLPHTRGSPWSVTRPTNGATLPRTDGSPRSVTRPTNGATLPRTRGSPVGSTRAPFRAPADHPLAKLLRRSR